MIDIEKIRRFSQEAKNVKIDVILEDIENRITKAALKGYNDVIIEMRNYPLEIRAKVISRLKKGGFIVNPKYFLVSNPLQEYIINW
jgi:hypothetical protein